METPAINLNVNLDAATMDAETSAKYIADLIAELTLNLDNSGTSSVGTPAHIVGIDRQLGRLMDFDPVHAPRVKRLHNELVALGYTPTLPKSKKKLPPSYLSYLDAKGNNFGNLNSKTFIVMRSHLRDSLADAALFDANPRYAFCELDSEEAVDAVLEVAKDEMN